MQNLSDSKMIEFLHSVGNYLCELSAKYKKAKYAFIFLKINCKLEKN